MNEAILVKELLMLLQGIPTKRFAISVEGEFCSLTQIRLPAISAEAMSGIIKDMVVSANMHRHLENEANKD